VRDQPLTVPRGGADHGQGLHPGGGVDPGERGRGRQPGLGRPHDEPAGQAHQGRGRAGGQDRERQPRREPARKPGPPSRPAVPALPPDVVPPTAPPRTRRPRVRCSQPRIRPPSRSITRSAIPSTASEWLATRAVRPRSSRASGSISAASVAASRCAVGSSTGAGGAGLAEGDVVGQGAGKQVGMLADQQRPGRPVGGRPVDERPAFAGPQPAPGHLEQGGLPRPRGTGDAEYGARRHEDADIAERGPRAAREADRDVLYRDAWRGTGRRYSGLPVLQ
jgi:hypothetical protein